MDKKNNILYWAVGAGVILLFIGAKSKKKFDPIGVAADLIADFESFSSRPYWDVSRYSWGYGTQAPGPTGYITRDQARAEMVDHISNDYSYLAPKIFVDLSDYQWAALLSFSYNLGAGNAAKLIRYINSKDWNTLQNKWLQYVYAGGERSSDLIDRRQREIQYFFA